jgi:hypothetical protein
VFVSVSLAVTWLLPELLLLKSELSIYTRFPSGLAMTPLIRDCELATKGIAANFLINKIVFSCGILNSGNYRLFSNIQFWRIKRCGEPYGPRPRATDDEIA